MMTRNLLLAAKFGNAALDFDKILYHRFEKNVGTLKKTWINVGLFNVDIGERFKVRPTSPFFAQFGENARRTRALNQVLYWT